MNIKEGERLRELENENIELHKILANQLLKAKPWRLLWEKPLTPQQLRSVDKKFSTFCRVSGESYAMVWIEPFNSAIIPKPRSDKKVIA